MILEDRFDLGVAVQTLDQFSAGQLGLNIESGALVTANPAQDWIAYEVALEDGNKDGRLDERDPRTLDVSGLDGRNLRRAALHNKIPYYTTISAARVAVDTIVYLKQAGPLDVFPLQDYIERKTA